RRAPGAGEDRGRSGARRRGAVDAAAEVAPRSLAGHRAPATLARSRRSAAPMLEPELAEAYDRTRPLSTKPFRAACYAPANSMYLDTYGLVRACCVNRRYVLGDLREQRLDDVWFGKRAKALRDAMKRYELRLGCEFCD